MSILLTGSTGMVGRNIKEHNLLNYDKLTYAGNLDNLSSISNFVLFL